MPLRKQIGSNYPCAFPAGKNGKDDSNWALADHQYRFVLLQPECLDTFHAGVNRLDKRGLFERNPVGDANHAAALDDPVHHAHELREASTAGLVTGRDPHLLVCRALRKDFVLAVITLVAGNVMEDHHAIAKAKVFDPFTDGGDNA